MAEYKQGEIAFYHDSGEVDKVEILDVLSNKKVEKYKLKILKVVRESSSVKPSNVGDVFICEKRRDFSGYGGLWHLLNYD